jgi:anaerobic selenocysteine-containing dehydrogenase
MVSLDIYVNETTPHTDVILPGPSPLEESHYDVFFSQFGHRNVARFSPLALSKPDHIVATFGDRAKLHELVDPMFHDLIEQLAPVDKEAGLAWVEVPSTGGRLNIPFIVSRTRDTKGRHVGNIATAGRTEVTALGGAGNVTYTCLVDLPTATDKARRDAPSIAVCEI